MNYTNFYTLYLAKMRSDELIRIAELERIGREALMMNRKKRNRPAVITNILQGAGNALVSTGNRLLKIA